MPPEAVAIPSPTNTAGQWSPTSPEAGDGAGNRGVYLITGGSGYIGSHTVLQFLRNNEQVVVVDNLSNASKEALVRVEKLAGKRVQFHQADLVDREALENIFRSYPIRAVIHFAGLKAVGESVRLPLKYYRQNVVAGCVLLEVMEKFNVRKIVFSSSATVYGQPDSVPIPETAPLRCTNPYGRTKLFLEEILRDLCTADKRWSAVLLRYFNPCGADESGLIGEDPNSEPNNLVPYITQVASGKLERLRVFGTDYSTPDGTGVRDFLHVVDLAHGHVAAVKKVEKSTGCEVYNLGCGKGYSVLQMIHEFEKVSGRRINHEMCPRRSGDVGEVIADASKANRELNWTAKKGITEMCRDAWRWQRSNPSGYNGPLLPPDSSLLN